MPKSFLSIESGNVQIIWVSVAEINPGTLAEIKKAVVYLPKLQINSRHSVMRKLTNYMQYEKIYCKF